MNFLIGFIGGFIWGTIGIQLLILKNKKLNGELRIEMKDKIFAGIAAGPFMILIFIFEKLFIKNINE